MKQGLLPTVCGFCCAVILSGCATIGVRNADSNLDALPCSDAATSLVDAQKCLAVQEKTYLKTALDYTDENTDWNYGFTAGALGGVGAAAFDSSLAALKAIGLALGGATAFNNVRAPSAMAALYLGAAKAMSCMYSASLGATTIETTVQINVVLGKIESDSLNAQSYANTTSAGSDKNLTLLTPSITAATAAQQVAQNALSISDAPGAFIMHQADDARLQIVGKLNAAPINVATVQQNIAASVANENSKISAVAGANSPVPIKAAAPGGGGGGGGGAPPPPPPDAIYWTTTLQSDIRDVLRYSQGLADIKADVPVCLTDIPS